MPVSTPKELRKEVAREKIYDTQVYFILFILISAILPLSAPSEPISSSSSSTTSSAPTCKEALKWPNFCFALKNSSLLSERAQEELTRRETRAREMFCDMARLLTKIDCEQPYSVNQNQSLKCQEAYRDWACSIVVEFGDEEEYDSEKRMSGSLMPFPSCDSICHRVLRVCPYLTPDRTQLGPTGHAALHPSQYGGHPAFYCPSRTGLIFSNLKSRTEEVQAASGGGSVKPHRWFYKRGSEVNLTDELISSNDTSCCWTYASALKTEQFEDLSLEIKFSTHELPLRDSLSLFSLVNDEVLIQCLHVYSETVLSVNNNNNNANNNNKEEEEESDSTYNYNNFLVIDDETINSNTIITKKIKKSYTKQSVNRGASAQTQMVTEESDGGSEGGIDERNSFLQTVVGDSSEANYYIRDDWFEVSPRSKIQKRNNYNFLTLVSSSTNNNNNNNINNNNNDIINDNNNQQQQQQQQQQSPSSSVLSSDEDETDSGVYSGGPILDADTDTENDGDSSSSSTTLDQHHHLHHLLHHEHPNDDEFMTSRSSIGNTVASSSTGDESISISRSNSRHRNFVHEQSNNNKNNYYDKHENTNRNNKNNYYNSDEILSSPSSTSASSSASRMQPLKIKLPALNLPLLTIQHYYHFPVLLLLLLLLLTMILLLLMVLLTTNFLPFKLLLNTSFISSTLVVLKNDKYNDNYYDDENEKGVHESITLKRKATATATTTTTIETTANKNESTIIRPPPLTTFVKNDYYYCNSIIIEEERKKKKEKKRKDHNITILCTEKTVCYNYDNNNNIKNNNKNIGGSSSNCCYYYYFRKPIDNSTGIEIMMIKMTYNNNNKKKKYYYYYYYNYYYGKYIMKRKATITSETVVRYIINQHQLILSSQTSYLKIIRLVGYYNYCNRVLILLQVRKKLAPFLKVHYWIVDDSNRKKISTFLFILLILDKKLQQGHFKLVCILCITKKTKKMSHNILPVTLRKTEKRKHYLMKLLLLRRIRLLVIIQNYNDKLLLLIPLHLRNLITLISKPFYRLAQNCCCNSIKSEKSCSDNNSIHCICHYKKNQLLTMKCFTLIIILIILTLLVILLVRLRLLMPILLLLLLLPVLFYNKCTIIVKTATEMTIRYWSNLRINKIIKVITIMTIVFTSWGFLLLL